MSVSVLTVFVKYIHKVIALVKNFKPRSQYGASIWLHHVNESFVKKATFVVGTFRRKRQLIFPKSAREHFHLSVINSFHSEKMFYSIFSNSIENETFWK